MDNSGLPTAVTVLGAPWCGDCRRSKQMLDRLGVGYAWVNLEADPGRMDEVLERTGGRQTIPVIVFSDGSHLVEPSDAALRDKLERMGLVPHA